ncbi:MAG: glycosyltransferase [Nitrosomonadales bacterium]|nr:glycosyltransferase [Nitrosomonadales bacterium]
MCTGAIRAFHEGNVALSRTLFNKTLETYPDDPSALHGLARLDLNDGQLDTAEILARWAIEINPSVGEFSMTMALILEASHKYEDALEFARQAGINPTFRAAADALARRLPVTARATLPVQPPAAGVSRLAPCPCGSGHRFKECCGAIRPNQEPYMTNADRNSRVTIVMTIRERYSLTIQALKSILSNTPPIFRLIFVDCHSPAWIREQLETLARQYGIELVYAEEFLWPNQARTKVLDRISSEYTVFIDNDVQVESGWLEKLVACADEAGAGIVGPLYLFGATANLFQKSTWRVANLLFTQTSPVMDWSWKRNISSLIVGLRTCMNSFSENPAILLNTTACWFAPDSCRSMVCSTTKSSLSTIMSMFHLWLSGGVTLLTWNLHRA